MRATHEALIQRIDPVCAVEAVGRSCRLSGGPNLHRRTLGNYLARRLLAMMLFGGALPRSFAEPIAPITSARRTETDE
jgi:hypothetical protein